MTRKLVLSLLLFGGLAGGYLFWRWHKNTSTKMPALAKNNDSITLPFFAPASPSPVPFQEMTIPSLRERTYQSQLADLKQVAKNSAYTSYLTNYQSDGLKIEALITQPSGEKPTSGWPAIVFIHGYIPPAQYRTQEKYVEYVNALARSGFVVFKIDLRGHGNSQGEPAGAYYSPEYIIDTLNARSALQNSGFVNPERIGLWGHSMAGNVVLRSLVSAQNIPVAVIWAGAVYSYEDMQAYGIDDNSYRPPSSTSPSRQQREKLFETHGNFNPQDPFWMTVAPTNYLQGLQSAIQVHHAVDDEVVSVEYSRNLNKLLEEAQVEHEVFEYPRGGHNITSPSFTPAMQRTIEFFKKHLEE